MPCLFQELTMRKKNRQIWGWHGTAWDTTYGCSWGHQWIQYPWWMQPLQPWLYPFILPTQVRSPSLCLETSLDTFVFLHIFAGDIPMFRWSSHVYICGWLRNHQLVTMKVCKQYQTIASKSGIYVVYCGFVSPSTPGFIADHPQSYPVAVLTTEAQEVSQGWWKAELCSASFRGGAEWDWRSSHERFLAVELNRYYIKKI